MEPKSLSTLELNEMVAKKAGEDEAFRLALLDDPRTALEKGLDVEIPGHMRIEVHVESLSVLHLIIPAADTGELSDDDLEGVAGGLKGGVPSPRVRKKN